MDDDEVAEYIRVGKETDEYAKVPTGISRMAPRGTPLQSEKWQRLSSNNRANFRRKIARASPDGNLQHKDIGYEELVDAEKSRLKRVRSSRSDSEEEDDRLKELTNAKVVNSEEIERQQLREEVIVKQQRELDFYSSKAKSHRSTKDGISQLNEAKQRIKRHGHLRLRPKYEVGDYVSFTDRES